MKKFTQGVWNINKHSSTTVESNGRSIATTGGYSDNSNMEQVDIENLANAKLIAAAPELLETLIEVVRISDRNHDAWNKAKEAIKKATE